VDIDWWDHQNLTFWSPPVAIILFHAVDATKHVRNYKQKLLFFDLIWWLVLERRYWQYSKQQDCYYRRWWSWYYPAFSWGIKNHYE